MCIIVAKNKNVKLPSKEILQNCFINNPDGAGYMYAKNNKVYIKKGFMTFEEFYKSVTKDIDTKTTAVLHFRISTQGGVQQALTHPYPICNNFDNMKQLENTCNIGIAHNGVISYCSNSTIQDYNDTMLYIKNILYYIIKNNSKFYTNDNTIQLLNNTSCNNRLAILSKDGTLTLIGTFITDNGINYSNDSYSYSYLKYYDNCNYNYNYDNYYDNDYDYYYNEKTGLYEFSTDKVCPCEDSKRKISFYCKWCKNSKNCKSKYKTKQ